MPKLYKVDTILLEHIETFNGFVSEKKSIDKALNVLGITQDQFSLSFSRLIDSGHLRYTDEAKKWIRTVSAPKVDFPWNSTEFIDAWENYRQYRKQEHKKDYRSIMSEQAGLNKLFKLTLGDEQLAILAIEETISNRWLGIEHGIDKLKERYSKDAGTRNASRAKDIVGQVYTNNS